MWIIRAVLQHHSAIKVENAKEYLYVHKACRYLERNIEAS